MEKSNSRGQALVEFNIAIALLLVPFCVAAGSWLRLDWEKSKCAYESYSEARSRLIHTRARASIQKKCGDAHEDLELMPLEMLDRKTALPSSGP